MTAIPGFHCPAFRILLAVLILIQGITDSESSAIFETDFPVLDITEPEHPCASGEEQR